MIIYINHNTINQNTINQNTINRYMTTFCKICYDAGKSDYFQHNIREWNPKTNRYDIICSYLKNLTCSNCGGKAHTARYCKEVKNKSQNMIPVCAVKPIKPVKAVIVTKNTTNMFHVLNSFTEELEKETHNIKKLGYTADGECLGTLDDIIWGFGFKNSIPTRWGVNTDF